MGRTLAGPFYVTLNINSVTNTASANKQTITAVQGFFVNNYVLNGSHDIAFNQG